MKNDNFIFDLNGSLESFPYFFEVLEDWCKINSIEESVKKRFFLILDEWLVNVAKHGYLNKGGPIKVAVESHCKKRISASISDKGSFYDPTINKFVDTKSDLDVREVGGLGVFFIKKMTKCFNYQRVNEWNVVTLIVE